MAAPTAPAKRLTLRENLHLLDYAILALAFTSLLVFLLDQTSALAGAEFEALRYVDITLCVIYVSMYVTKLSLSDSPGRWLRRHAIHSLGTLPLTVPLILPERFHIVVALIVVGLRAGHALDRAFGAKILQGLIERYRSMVIEELSDPLLMRLAIVLEEAVVSRDYAAAIGKRLDERRDLVEAAVARAIAASPKLSRLHQFTPVQRFVDDTTREVVDAAHAALTGPEINTLIREGLQDAFSELKHGIRERKWQGKGVGVTDVALGVVGGNGHHHEGRAP